MSVQTTYDDTPAVGFPGMLAEQFSKRQVDSRLAEGADIGFGSSVEAGTDGEKQVIRLATAVNISGIALSELADFENSGSSELYSDEDMLPILTSGRVWVLAGGAVAYGAEVTPSVGAASGKFTSGANLLADYRVFARSAAAADDDLLLVEIVGPQGAVA